VETRRCAAVPIRAEENDRQTLWTGLAVELHKDDVESYYHNLMAEHPSVFVVARDEGDAPLEPYLITVSYGEASSYMETDECVFSIRCRPRSIVGSSSSCWSTMSMKRRSTMADRRRYASHRASG